MDTIYVNFVNIENRQYNLLLCNTCFNFIRYEKPCFWKPEVTKLRNSGEFLQWHDIRLHPRNMMKLYGVDQSE